MAAGLASAGANVMLVSRNAELGEEGAATIREAFGTKAMAFSGDVTDINQMEAMASTAMDAFGSIDILINSAGINIRGPIDELTYDDFNQVIDINVNGTWLASRAVTPHMKAAGKGSIINIASTLGVVGVPNRTPYASSKGAVVQMTRALALELAPFNITVNAIALALFLPK